MTLKSDIIAKANEIIALANQINDGGNPPPPPVTGLVNNQCLPSWSNTGLFSGWNIASLPTSIPDNNSANLASYEAACAAAPEGSIFAIGDSITQRNTFAQLAADCAAGGKQFVNLGYGGEMMRRLMYRLSNYPNHRAGLNKASAVIINTGVNDLGFYFDNHPPEVGASGAHNAAIMVGDYHFKDLAMQAKGKWVFMGVLPINEPAATASVAGTTGRDYTGYNADIALMNQKIKASLEAHCTAQYRFIDPAVDMPALFDAQGNLKDEHDDGDDAIHPNLNCYDTVINPVIRAKLVELGVLS